MIAIPVKLNILRFKFLIVLLLLLVSILLTSIIQVSGAQTGGYEGGASDSNSRAGISGVRITFVSEDGSFSREVISNANGSYRIELPVGRYRVTATHPNYETYSTGSGFFVVPGSSFQIGDIYMVQNTAGAGAQTGSTLTDIWVVIKTGDVEGADTDDDFQLLVRGKTIALPSGGYSWDENERGRTETYGWNLQQQRYSGLNLSVTNIGGICIETLGSNAWFIESIWVLGRTDRGVDVLLAGKAYFRTWMSRDSNEGESVLDVITAGGCLGSI